MDTYDSIRDGGGADERVVPDNGTSDYLDVVFDGPPGHKSGRFIEVEDSCGNSINPATWIAPKSPGGFWRLRFKRGYDAAKDI